MDQVGECLEEPPDVEAGAVPAKAQELLSIPLIRQFVECSAQELSENGPLAQQAVDADDGGPFTRAEGHGTFAKRARHCAQKFFGVAQSDGNHHQAEREGTCKRGEMPEGMDHDCERENSDYDGGDAVQEISGIPNDKCGVGAAEFGHVHAAEKTDGHANQCC